MKGKNHVSKNFFRDHPLDEVSAARFAYFSMTVGFNDDLNDFVREYAEREIEPQRLELICRERDRIPQIDSAEEIVRMMRGNCDILNQKVLCEKALEMQDEVLPLIIRRFFTSVQDAFIENAILVLNLADEKYLGQIINRYSEIRSPYAQSMICVVLSEHADEEMNGFLVEEYYRLFEEYPDEPYAEGPLLALYIINDKGF